MNKNELFSKVSAHLAADNIKKRFKRQNTGYTLTDNMTGNSVSFTMHNTVCASKFTIDDVEFVLNGFFDVLAEELSKGNDLKIKGFGRFYLRRRKSNFAINPMTGELVRVKNMYSVKFKPGENLTGAASIYSAIQNEKEETENINFEDLREVLMEDTDDEEDDINGD